MPEIETFFSRRLFQTRKRGVKATAPLELSSTVTLLGDFTIIIEATVKGDVDFTSAVDQNSTILVRYHAGNIECSSNKGTVISNTPQAIAPDTKVQIKVIRLGDHCRCVVDSNLNVSEFTLTGAVMLKRIYNGSENSILSMFRVFPYSRPLNVMEKQFSDLQGAVCNLSLATIYLNKWYDPINKLSVVGNFLTLTHKGPVVPHESTGYYNPFICYNPLLSEDFAMREGVLECLKVRTQSYVGYTRRYLKPFVPLTGSLEMPRNWTMHLQVFNDPTTPNEIMTGLTTFSSVVALPSGICYITVEKYGCIVTYYVNYEPPVVQDTSVPLQASNSLNLGTTKWISFEMSPLRCSRERHLELFNNGHPIKDPDAVTWEHRGMTTSGWVSDSNNRLVGTSAIVETAERNFGLQSKTLA